VDVMQRLMDADGRLALDRFDYIRVRGAEPGLGRGSVPDRGGANVNASDE
jgi:hypothetical protein